MTGIRALLLLAAVAAGDPPAAPPPTLPTVPVPRTFPPFFVENRGQVPEHMQYVGYSQDGIVGIQEGGVLLRPPWAFDALAVQYLGGASSKPVPEIPLPTKISCFLAGLRTVMAGGIPTCGAVKQSRVWPGVDVVWTFGYRGPQMVIRLAPDADPGSVQLAFPEGAEARVEGDGDLFVGWTDRDSLRKPVPAGLRFTAPAGTVFKVESSGTATLVGPRGAAGTGTSLVSEVRGLKEGASCWHEEVCGTGIAPDGTIVVVGRTSVFGAPGWGIPPADPRLLGFRVTDVFVARIDPSGTVLKSLTFYGGGGGMTPRSMAIGHDGSVAVVGHTLMLELPTTPGAFQSRPLRTMGSFVVRFAPAADALVFSSWLGATTATDISNGASAWAVAMDRAGAVYVAGEACSDFPFSGIPAGAGPGPAQSAVREPRRGLPGGPFLAKFRPEGKSLEYCVPLATQSNATPCVLGVDSAGGAWVAGRGGGGRLFPRLHPLPGNSRTEGDTFLIRVAPDGKSLTSAGVIPCKASVSLSALLVDGSDSPLLVGAVRGDDFPVVRPAMATFEGPDWDLFVSRIEPDGGGFRHSSYFGFGIGHTELNASIALDPEGRAVVAGSSWSPAEKEDTPPERRSLLRTRWYYTVWSPEGRLLRTEDIDLMDRDADNAFVAVGRDGTSCLGGTLEIETESVPAYIPARRRAQAFVLLLDVAGRGRFPEASGGLDPRFLMRPVERRPIPARSTEPMAAGAGRAADGLGGVGPAGESGTDGGKSGGSDPGEGKGTADPGLRKGLLVDRPLAGADRIRVEGRIDAETLEAAGGFDPDLDDLQIQLGDRNAPFLFSIPAKDPGWHRSASGKLEWRSSAESPTAGHVILFPDRGTFSIRLYGFDFPAQQANPIGVVLETRRGGFAGGEARWKSKGEGVFRYPE